MKDVVANGDVDDGREEDADPDGHVVSVDSKVVPRRPDPTPQLFLISTHLPPLFSSFDRPFTYGCIPVYVGTTLILDQQESQGRDKRGSEADQAVNPQVLPERRRIRPKEKNQKDVDGHGKRPPRI
jgi:hypothetical protein